MTMDYKFNSETEPSDEQLAQIMHEVTVEAKEKSETADKKLFEQIRILINEKKLHFKYLM